MAMQMTIKIEGSPRLLKKIRRTGIELNDMSQELRLASKFLKEFYSGKVFDSQGNVIGKKWPPLNVPYRKRKQRLAPGKGPLEFSGKMRESFRAKSDKNKATIFNTANYFGFHQLGTRDIPVRTMMTLDKQRQKEVSEIIFRGVRKRVRRAFR